MSGPWMKFYPSDWRSDPCLRSCSMGARGFWIEMLCIMHEAEPYGYFLINSMKISAKNFAKICGISESFCQKYLLELARAGVYSVDETGRIYSRRMLKDKAKLERDRENGKGGGNPNLTRSDNAGVNPPDKAQKPDTRSQIPEASKQEAARAVVSGSEKALRSDLMEIFPGAPNYDRTAVWLGKGYAPSMIREVVKELLARKPDIANLAYFDAALAERHGKRSETPSERAAGAAALDYDKVVAMFAKTGHWSRYAGPEPGLTGCKASPELLAQYGIAPDGRKLAMAS